MPASDHFRWNQRTLHLVFAASSVVLLLSVLLMMKQDQADEWRAYQLTQFDLEAAVKEKDLQSVESEAYKKSIRDLEAKVAKAQSKLSDSQAKLDELLAEQDQQTREVDRLEVELKAKNSIRDEARSDYDLAVASGAASESLQGLLEAFDERQAECDETQKILDEAKELVRVTTDSLKELTADRDSVQAELDKVVGEADRIRVALENIKPTETISSIKRSMMEWPIIDGFNSHLKVVQDWLPNLHQTLGMTQIARFDRCRTCHLNIDKTAAGNVAAFPQGSPEAADVHEWVAENSFPQPFSTHPNHELFCTASSPHPVSKFGCTICHEGQGSGTSFGNAEHTPNDPFAAHEWEKEYGYHPNHFWEYPMQPERFRESTCIKCHHNVTELAVNPRFGSSAPKVSRGFELVKQYGCFGCHEIHGYDAGLAIGPDLRLEPQTPEEIARIAADPGQVAGKMRKVGPSLRHIAEKTTRPWIEYWTEIPGRFRPSTRMPQFFNLTNQQDEKAAKYQTAELAGIASLLLNVSQPLETLKPADGYQANAERGRQLFSERGCLACHTHSAVESSKADFGPNISDIHLKAKRDTDNPAFSTWLYTWIREPD
ncbi:MAG: c-type cytochrome, partial [Planctomycetaceae bacterium]|nr:c-type cytochrome [Planctomycetaceae bacterium]